MNKPKNELIPTTIRLSRATLSTLNEASALKQITRADLIRFSIDETLKRWKARERKAIIERLVQAN